MDAGTTPCRLSTAATSVAESNGHVVVCTVDGDEIDLVVAVHVVEELLPRVARQVAVAEGDPSARITVVELDPEVTRVAYRFFGLRPEHGIATVHGGLHQ